MKKRYQDTLIDSLERKIVDWETIYGSSVKNLNTLLTIERDKSGKLEEIIDLEIKLRKYHQVRAHQLKRQRNWSIGIAGFATIFAAFKPP